MLIIFLLTEADGARAVFESRDDAYAFMRDKMWRDYSISNEFITMSWRPSRPGDTFAKLVIYNGDVPIAMVEALPFNPETENADR